MKKAIYWNSKQLQFLQATQPIKIFLGGRGSGKSTTESGEQYKLAAGMPRSKGFLSSTTYNQILTKTLPAVESKWAQMGLIEGADYVIGVKPPAGFEKCLEEPRKYDNVVSFSNGRRIEMLSMDRPDLARGGSYTDGAVDEMALVPQEHITKVLLPSLRMGLRDFGDSPLYRSFRGYTSIPWKPSGYYILDYEEKAKSNPGTYFFQESTAWDNVDVLGEEFIRMLERELPYLEFLVEVMNKRIRKVQDAFYHRFDPDKHTYQVRYLYDTGDRGIISNGIADQHYKPDGPIDFSFDFSGWFNPAIAFQEGFTKEGNTRRMVEYGIHQFHVKPEQGKVPELVDMICNHYQNHKHKVCGIWGEPRGHDQKPDTLETVYQQIQKRFRSHGWTADIKVKPGQVKRHVERNTYMNDLLGESNPALPLVRLNDQTCKDAIIAMQVTGTKPDGSKDKSRESDRLFPQEHAPHYTDLIDYFLMQKHGWKVKSMRSRGAMDTSIH
jgi:hypothetical protein